ncbi:MAG TPA: enolase C-terminal domain-like protein [Chloroflexota bacterium]|nr:enolase C-terminal domain-like protein [Chloroflexota bacterium]
MKVTSVERILVDVPFYDEPERNMARAHTGWHISEVCRVTTDSGLVGYGETLPNYTWGLVSDAAVERVTGVNPVDLMWDDSLGAGLQMALFDLAAKAADVPLYRLLGTKVREWCPISWWSIDMPPEDFATEARNAVAQGYTSYKLKARPWFDIREQVAAVCAVIPPAFHLDVDFNGLLVDAASAVPVLKDLEQFHNLAFFESPIPQGDVAGNKRVREQTRCAIAMHYGVPPIMTALREEVCDGFVIGGGASRVVREAAVSGEANKPFWLQLVGTGITTTFALHLGAVLSHARWPAVTCLNMYAHQLLREPLVVQGGYCRVPEAPGLGVIVDEDALATHSTSSSKKLDLRAVYAVLRPNGERTYYLNEDQYRDDFLGGNQPVFEPGVRLEVLPGDGSTDWTYLHRRVQSGPVRSGR